MSSRKSHPASLFPALLAAVFAFQQPALAQSGSASGDGTDEAILRDYYSANGLINRGLFELATAEYRQFLSQHGDHEKAPVARYGLAVCLFRMRQYDKAVVELARLRELNEFVYAAEAAATLGQCYLALERHAEAAEAFAVVVDRYSGHDLADDAAAGLIEALYLGGKLDQAVARCEGFLSQRQESPLCERVEFFGGLAQMGRKDYAAAARRFAELLDRHPGGQFADRVALLAAQCHHHDNAVERAVRAYRRVLKLTANQYVPDALLGLGMLLQGQGGYKEAGAMFDQLLEKFPDSPLVPTARFHRGRVWFELGRFDQAFEAFKQVADTEGELHDAAAYWMAKCKLRQGDFDDAARRLELAVEKSPQSDLLPEMCYDRGIALMRAGEHQAAIAAMKELRSRFPEHALSADALYLLAAIEHQRGRYDESGAYCEAFLGRHPSHELAATVSFLTAENHYLSERHDDAVKSYRGFLSQHPADEQAVKAKYRLGTALYRLKRFDEAVPLLSEMSDKVGEDPMLRSVLLALGDICFQRSEWKQARQHLSEYLSTGLDVPSADDALLKLGLAHQRQGQHEEALRAYDLLIKRFKDSPHRKQAMFERGQALVALKRYPAAAEAFEQVLGQEGADRFASYALNHLGTIALEGKDFGAADKFFARVAEAKPDDDTAAGALFQRGQALMAAERFKDAEEVFSRFQRDYSSHERVGQAGAQLAIALARQNRYADALKAIERVEREFAGALDPSLRATVQYEKAWCLRESGREDDAADAYRRLLEQDSIEGVDIHALLELGSIEERARRYEAAVKVLRRLRQVVAARGADVPRPVLEQGTYRLGVCEFELDRFEQAAEVFEEFITKFPDSSLAASASFFCGESLFKTGRQERAVSHLTRVVEGHGSDPICGPSLLRLGECLAGLQRWARSEQVFTQYVDRFGDDEQWFQAQFGIGWARENQKRYDEAISAYRQVVSRHSGPTAARAQFQIGECLFAEKRYEVAARALLKVDILYAYPEWSAAALYEAGRCFEKLGKPVEARAQFKSVIDRYEQTRWAEPASERLAQVSSGDLPGRAAGHGD